MFLPALAVGLNGVICDTSGLGNLAGFSSLCSSGMVPDESVLGILLLCLVEPYKMKMLSINYWWLWTKQSGFKLVG